MNLVLGKDEVHVWRAALDLLRPSLVSMFQTLSDDERDRANRYRFRKDREHFVLARGLLRHILGHYLGLPPGQLRFCYDDYGKPELEDEFRDHNLYFNVSHSDGLALYAVTCGRALGIDVERIREDICDEQIAERFFSPSEVTALSSLPEGLRAQAFFNCWTRKEAYIKAKGQGLSIPLDQFDVSLSPGEPAALLKDKFDPQEASRWSLQELSVEAGYVAALIVEGHDWQLKNFQWSAE